MNTLKIFAIALLSVLAIASCKKPVNNGPIDVDLHYDMVYMLGGNAFDADGNAHWDAENGIAMNKTNDPDVFVAEVELTRSAENKLIKFCLSDKPWDQNDFLVPALANMVDGKSYAYLQEGVNKLEASRETEPGVLRDHFFGLDKDCSGVWKLEVNPVELTLTATKISSKPDPEFREFEEGILYMVGDATPAGWDINQPWPMVKDGDIFTYEGVLKTGEMKIATAWDWGAEFYRPEVNATEISKNGIADEKVVCWIENNDEGKGDHKWKVVDEGNYKLTLDTKAMTMKAEWLGE